VQLNGQFFTALSTWTLQQMYLGLKVAQMPRVLPLLGVYCTVFVFNMVYYLVKDNTAS